MCVFKRRCLPSTGRCHTRVCPIRETVENCSAGEVGDAALASQLRITNRSRDMALSTPIHSAANVSAVAILHAVRTAQIASVSLSLILCIGTLAVGPVVCAARMSEQFISSRGMTVLSRLCGGHWPSFFYVCSYVVWCAACMYVTCLSVCHELRLAAAIQMVVEISGA